MADTTAPTHSPNSGSSGAETIKPASPRDANSRLSARSDSSQQTGAQEPRWSAYAENRRNPLPQFVDPSDNAPEVVPGQDLPKGEGVVDPFAGVPVTRPPLIEPDGLDPRSPAIVFAEPDKTWIERHRTWIVAVAVMIPIVIVGIVVGVVVATRQGGREGGSS